MLDRRQIEEKKRQVKKVELKKAKYEGVIVDSIKSHFVEMSVFRGSVVGRGSSLVRTSGKENFVCRNGKGEMEGEGFWIFL